MGRIATTILQDKDIRALQPDKIMRRYAVGNPQELYIRVYPSGTKTFILHFSDRNPITLKRFRKGIYSVKEAREEANKILHELAQGKSIEMIRSGNKNYTFKALKERYYKIRENELPAEKTYKNMVQRIETYLAKKLDNMDAKEIKPSYLFEILNEVYKPNEDKDRAEIVRRLIGHLNNIFQIAFDDGYIDIIPSSNLQRKFLTREQIAKKKGRDPRRLAVIKESDIKEFIQDLKATDIDTTTKNAIYFQILTGNRPDNTVSLKWKHIDLQTQICTVPAKDMKTKREDNVFYLNSYLMKILQIQKQICKNSEYVFPGIQNSRKHLNENRISQTMREKIANGKWRGRVQPYGFRSTFKTHTTLNLATLIQQGITEKTIEAKMDHKTQGIMKHYERIKATEEQNKILMQWYGDYLNSIEPLGI